MKFSEGESLECKSPPLPEQERGGKEDPLCFDETRFFFLFSTRWRHIGIHLPSASKPEDEPGTFDS